MTVCSGGYNSFSVCHLLSQINRCYVSLMSTLSLTDVIITFSNLLYVKNKRAIHRRVNIIIAYFVLRQFHRLFQYEFYRELDLVLSL